MKVDEVQEGEAGAGRRGKSRMLRIVGGLLAGYILLESLHRIHVESVYKVHIPVPPVSGLALKGPRMAVANGVLQN